MRYFTTCSQCGKDEIQSFRLIALWCYPRGAAIVHGGVWAARTSGETRRVPTPALAFSPTHARAKVSGIMCVAEKTKDKPLAPLVGRMGGKGARHAQRCDHAPPTMTCAFPLPLAPHVQRFNLTND